MAQPSLRAQVAIVGAGIYGCSTAYFLAKLGVPALVIDAGDVGADASGANAGNIHLQISPFSHAAKSREWIADFARSLPFFVEALALWRQLEHDLPADIELRCPGGIMVAETAEQMERLHEKVDLERAHGLNVEMLSARGLGGVAPYLSCDVLGASHCPDEGMANALGAVVALADAAQAAGTRFAPNTRVTGLARDGGGWSIQTTGGDVLCERVVIAAGSASDEVGAMAGVALPITRREIQMIATEPCERFVDHLVYHCEHRLTLKQVVNGHLLIGGGWTAGRDDIFHRPAVIRDSLLGSLRLAARIVPRLRATSILRTWAGTVSYTPDGWPILGEVPDQPGLYTAVCNTYGFTLGPLCGRVVAEAIAGLPERAPGEDFSPARFASAGKAVGDAPEAARHGDGIVASEATGEGTSASQVDKTQRAT